MRTRTWISAVAATGLLAAGVAVPAIAADGHPAPGSSSSSPAEQHRMDGQDDMHNMAGMHEQMMQQMPEMASIHEDMMQRAPGMARMHEQMMGGHPRDGISSAPTGEEQGQDR